MIMPKQFGLVTHKMIENKAQKFHLNNFNDIYKT